MNASPVYIRELATVTLAPSGTAAEAKFNVDWHVVALPIIQQKSAKDPVSFFKQWLAQMLILRPVPSLIRGESDQETLQPNAQLTDLGAWFAGILAQSPSAYAKVDEYLKPFNARSTRLYQSPDGNKCP